jgi:peptide chain release factor 3
MGRHFLGTYDLFADALLLFARGVHDRVVEPVRCNGLDDPKLTRLSPKQAVANMCQEVEMVKGLYPPFDQETYGEGQLTRSIAAARSIISGCANCCAASPS